jgi:hypothetical protein
MYDVMPVINQDYFIIINLEPKTRKNKRKHTRKFNPTIEISLMSIRINTIVDFLNINNLRPDHFKLASGAPAQGQLLSGSCRFAKSSQRWVSIVDSDF